MVNNMQRAIKVSAEAYKALNDESEKEEKPIGAIASAIILAALSADRTVTTDVTYTPNSFGEQYDSKTGRRIFPR